MDFGGAVLQFIICYLCSGMWHYASPLCVKKTALCLPHLVCWNSYLWCQENYFPGLSSFPFLSGFLSGVTSFIFTHRLLLRLTGQCAHYKPLHRIPNAQKYDSDSKHGIVIKFFSSNLALLLAVFSLDNSSSFQAQFYSICKTEVILSPHKFAAEYVLGYLISQAIIDVQ